jgi:hypothetical protein
MAKMESTSRECQVVVDNFLLLCLLCLGERDMSFTPSISVVACTPARCFGDLKQYGQNPCILELR